MFVRLVNCSRAAGCITLIEHLIKEAPQGNDYKMLLRLIVVPFYRKLLVFSIGISEAAHFNISHRDWTTTANHAPRCCL